MKRKLSVLLLAVSMALTFGVGPVAADVSIAQGTIGDVLMFSLYDLRVDPINPNLRTAAWENFLVIENTSGNWTAAHIRFRAYKKSIEVWDHVILLSPYDMFWLDMVRDGDRVMLWSNDEGTLINSGLYYPDGGPPPDRLFSTYLSTDLMVACGYPDDPVETQYGEIEVIGLFQLEVPGGGVEDTHNLAEVTRDLFTGYQVDGVTPEPADWINVYDVQFGLFYEFDPTDTEDPWGVDTWACQQSPQPNTDLFWNAGWETYAAAEVWLNACEAPQFDCDSQEPACDGTTRMALDCGNVLTGAFAMGDLGNGRYELQNFVVLQDFRMEQAFPGTGELSPFHLDGFHIGAIVYPPTVMDIDIDVACYSDRFSGSPVAPFTGANAPWYGTTPAWYLNESVTSTTGPGFRHGDDINQENAEGDIDRFNDIFSLDDVENALGKAAAWFHYFDDWDPGALGYLFDTTVSFSFPTKHYHFWFYEPIWWGSWGNGNWAWWNDGLSGDPDGYLTRITGMRGIIATYYGPLFQNGVIKADSYIWDDEENLLPGNPGGEPSPVTWPDVIIPHEVNTILVGDCPGVLCIDEPGFEIGHFKIENVRLMNGRRGVGFAAEGHPMYKPTAAIPYQVYPVGGVTFLNYWPDLSIVRSCITNWHYVPFYPLDED